MRESFKVAVKNIATHGDTDVFPFPIENHIFFDSEDETVELLMTIHNDFDDFILKYPPFNENSLTVVGYTGFRSATQLDPIWNAYLLGLVISVGADIEKARILIEKQMVFSYRFKYDENQNTLFDTSVGWRQFQQMSVEHSKKFSHVLICDIADFYPRVYHHRIENALDRATKQTQITKRIMEILKRISGGVSFGLPIGGPAARLLSELLLNPVDRLLMTSGITFCRFSDDYHIFASSREESYAHLVFLSQKLLENEGLSLQKSKTRIMSSEEFLSMSEFVEPDEPLEKSEAQARNFLSLRLHYDPYSPTADEDYDKLKRELGKFDIVGMIGREIGKSRIHQALAKKLIGVVRYLDAPVLNDTLRSLVDSLSLLYPVFSNVMLLIKNVLPSLDGETQSYVFGRVRELVGSADYTVKVPINLCYSIRVLAEDYSQEAEELLARIYNETTSIMIKRDIILIMAKRHAHYWISDARRRFYGLTPWERRSLIIASFILGDEGKHWRNQIRKELSPIDELSQSWAVKKMMTEGWSIPV